MNTLYPMFMNLERRPVLVVGGGASAAQKIRGLLDSRADITVIAPGVSPVIDDLAAERKITLRRRSYASGDVSGFVLVVGATDDPAVQREIFDDAQREHIPVNIVDVPGLCSFFLASVFQQGDLKVAVSTNGASPTLGKLIRDRIQEEFSEGYPEVLETLGRMRPEVQKAFPDYESRKAMFGRLAGTEMDRHNLRHVGRPGRTVEPPVRTGAVYLVGAGPGDPELITVKGLRILRLADVVMYDALVNTQLLSHAPAGAEKILVGKRAGARSIGQEEINDLLILKARQGKRVVRLKGGDPFMFGRGGEELDALRAAGIDAEVVPGITAGGGASAALGIPLTHREESSSVVFVTGHESPGKIDGSVDWEAVSRIDTIVIYMGVGRLRLIARQLMLNGLSPLKPVAVIYDGTLPSETVICGNLEDIAHRVQGRFIGVPGIIVIGDVVHRLGNHEISGIRSAGVEHAVPEQSI